jgi:2-keto-3-deoxy-L-rhamnonate aldolase RhmA
VRGTDNVEVQRCLDLGTAGLVFPQLANIEDFKRAAAMMDHSPVGTRGYNPFVRSYDYGSAVKETSSPDQPWFIPIIETLSAVEDIESILTIERIDLVYIGSYDLSAQLGCPGQMDDPRMQEITERILSACAMAGKPVGHIAMNTAKVAELKSQGVKAIVHGVESHRILESFSTIVGKE